MNIVGRNGQALKLSGFVNCSRLDRTVTASQNSGMANSFSANSSSRQRQGTTIVLLLLFFCGVLLFSLGIVGEYLREVQGKPSSVVRKIEL